MSYKIKINDLKKAIYEAAMKRKSEYEGLRFVDKIFKENKHHTPKIKKIIRENRDNGKAIYNYLLNECGCASKYEQVRDYMPTYEEEEILFDLDEDLDNPWEQEDWADLTGDYTNYPEEYEADLEFPKVGDEMHGGAYDYEKEGDIYDTGFPSIEHERDYSEAGDDFIPEYWIAEQMFEGVSKRKKAYMRGMSKEEIIGQIEEMEKKGYSLTAFRNEAEMNKYLSGYQVVNKSLNKPYKQQINEINRQRNLEVNQFPNLKKIADRAGIGLVKSLQRDFSKYIGRNVDFPELDIEMYMFKKFGKTSTKNKGISDKNVKFLEKILHDKKKITEIDDNLPPGVTERDIEYEKTLKNVFF